MVVEESERNKGNMSAFLKIIEEIAVEMERHVYVEIVMNDILALMLEKRDYTRDSRFEERSYWKFFSKKS